jgi:putative NADH-flavin reductase
MRIIIFGASGATGRELVRQAVAARHEVSVFVRDPDKLDARGGTLRVVQGDVVDAAAVATAMHGQEAVLSALGAPSPFRPYPAFLEGVRNILSAMGQSGRLVYLSFIGVPQSRDQFGFFGAHFIAPVVRRHATEGHRRNEEAIMRSAVDWTIVRAPKLTSGPLTSTYRVGERLTPRGFLPTIARADVAELMLSQLVDARHRRTPISIMH